MNPVQYAYVCHECGHCVLFVVRHKTVRIVCPLCLEPREFLLSSIVTDHGEYEEWLKI